jgi:hypothetical protein
LELANVSAPAYTVRFHKVFLDIGAINFPLFVEFSHLPAVNQEWINIGLKEIRAYFFEGKLTVMMLMKFLVIIMKAICVATFS